MQSKNLFLQHLWDGSIRSAIFPWGSLQRFFSINDGILHKLLVAEDPESSVVLRTTVPLMISPPRYDSQTLVACVASAFQTGKHLIGKTTYGSLLHDVLEVMVPN